MLLHSGHALERPSKNRQEKSACNARFSFQKNTSDERRRSVAARRSRTGGSDRSRKRPCHCEPAPPEVRVTRRGEANAKQPPSGGLTRSAGGAYTSPILKNPLFISVQTEPVRVRQRARLLWK